MRSDAWTIHDALQERVGAVPWVQAAVVVWGEFAEERREVNKVVYVRGDKLVGWLTGLRHELPAPQRAAIRVALEEVRERQSKEWNSRAAHTGQ